MPLAEITFFAQKKCYLSEQRRYFSGQNGVFVGADAVYVGGGAVVVYPLAGSSNQRPALQSDSEPHRHSAHLSGVEMMVMTSLGR